jgi:uncharacterized protein
VIKLLVEETGSRAFAGFYDSHAGAEWVSSALLCVEVVRTVARAMPALLPDARDLLLAFSCIAIDDDIVPAANALATYDGRLVAAAKEAGIDTVSPRTWFTTYLESGGWSW